MRSLHLVGGVMVSLLATVAISAQNNTIPPLQRIIETPLEVQTPPHPCAGSVPVAVFLLGHTAGVLSGAERLPGICDPDVEHEHLHDSTSLQGLTVEAALTKLVEIDPRYSWREVDGVIVMRPVVAWAASDNPLNRHITGFTASNRNYRGSLDLFRASLFNDPPSVRPDHEDPGETLRKKFSVTVPNGPAIEALNRIVRAHGALNWMVSYKTAPASVDAMWIQLHGWENAGTAVQKNTEP